MKVCNLECVQVSRVSRLPRYNGYHMTLTVSVPIIQEIFESHSTKPVLSGASEVHDNQTTLCP